MAWVDVLAGIAIFCLTIAIGIGWLLQCLSWLKDVKYKLKIRKALLSANVWVLHLGCFCHPFVGRFTKSLKNTCTRITCIVLSSSLDTLQQSMCTDESSRTKDVVNEITSGIEMV